MAEFAKGSQRRQDFLNKLTPDQMEEVVNFFINDFCHEPFYRRSNISEGSSTLGFTVCSSPTRRGRFGIIKFGRTWIPWRLTSSLMTRWLSFSCVELFVSSSVFER